MKARASILAAMIGFVACDDDRSAGGGGFETGNIRARVVSPSGKPAARALVWLVASQGDSAPARVIDSAWTNSAGIADLRIPLETGRLDLGLDARLEDSLGIALAPWRSGDAPAVKMSARGTLVALADSTGVSPSIFVPGSHFTSSISAGTGRSSIDLPQGSWKIAFKSASTLSLPMEVTVEPTPKQVAPPSESDKSLDSDDTLAGWITNTLYRDTTFPGWAEWTPLAGAGEDGAPLLASLATTTGDSLRLSTLKAAATDANQSWSGVALSAVPAQGALELSFRSTSPEGISRQSRRILKLLDDSNSGIVVEWAGAAKDSVRVRLITAGVGANQQVQVSAEFDLNSPSWQLAWSSKYFSFRSTGSAPFVFKDYVPGGFTDRNLHLELLFGSDSIGVSTSVALGPPKLYRPK